MRLHPLSKSYGTTRKHPRTMQEAFGPHTDDALHPLPEPRTWGAEDRIVTWLMIVLAACLVLAVVVGAEWLPGGGK